MLHKCTYNRRNRLVFNVRKSATSITGKTTDIKQWFTVHKCVTHTATASLSYKKDSSGATIWSLFHFFSSKLVGLVWQVVRWLCFKVQPQVWTCMRTHEDMSKHHSADSRTSAGWELMNSLIYELLSDICGTHSQLYSVDLMESYSLTSSANRKELNTVTVPLIYICYRLWPRSHKTVFSVEGQEISDVSIRKD